MVEVKTTEFEFSHGKKPSGTGYWAFEIGGETFWHAGLYSAAKKLAVALAVSRGVQIVKVMP
jgi:hypothetical protein